MAVYRFYSKKMLFFLFFLTSVMYRMMVKIKGCLMTLAGCTCVNGGRMNKQTVNRRDSFNCTGCRVFGIARGGFASCRASPLPRWCAGRFGVCECPGKVCPARRCLTRRSAAPRACSHCQRWRQTRRDAYSNISMQHEPTNVSFLRVLQV